MPTRVGRGDCRSIARDSRSEEGEPRGPVPPGDNLVTFIIVVVTFCLLATPISLGALVDIVRAIRGH